MSLLTESLPFDYKPIVEELEGGRKVYKLKGILQRGDTPNGNRRVYPTRLLEREVSKVQELIKTRAMVGEIDHPGDRLRPLYSEASHIITELEMRGNECYGAIEIIPGTRKGSDLLGLYEAGVRMAISSRGSGSLKPMGNGLTEVQDDYQLFTFDIVNEPSTPGAFLHENRLYEPNDNEVTTVIKKYFYFK